MLWWIWIVAGLGLLLAELLTPGGFYLLFFGLSAIVVGALAGLGLAGPQWFEWFLFAVLAVAALVLFRRRLVERFHRAAGAREVDSLVGQVAVAKAPIAVDQIGAAELRGSTWQARNLGPSNLSEGERCVVERVEGLMLIVRKS